MKSLTPEVIQKLIWEIQAVLPPDYGIELPWPEPKDECKPLLTEKGVRIVEQVSMKDVEGNVYERNILCEWKSALYVKRIMKLDNKTLNCIHSELKKALKRAEKGSSLQQNTSQIGIQTLTNSYRINYSEANHLLEESIVKRGYALTIPKKIRKSLKIKEGDSLIWKVQRLQIVITPKK